MTIFFLTRSVVFPLCPPHQCPRWHLLGFKQCLATSHAGKGVAASNALCKDQQVGAGLALAAVHPVLVAPPPAGAACTGLHLRGGKRGAVMLHGPIPVIQMWLTEYEGSGKTEKSKKNDENVPDYTKVHACQLLSRAARWCLFPFEQASVSHRHLVCRLALAHVRTHTHAVAHNTRNTCAHIYNPSTAHSLTASCMRLSPHPL